MKTNLDQIKAGADIHAGDGGYSIGTQEAQDKFAQARNQSLAKSRIRELMLEAGYAAPELAGRANKLAELIVRECANVAAEHDALDIYEEIREHFGVEE